jgi:hypothetical protein
MRLVWPIRFAEPQLDHLLPTATGPSERAGPEVRLDQEITYLNEAEARNRTVTGAVHRLVFCRAVDGGTMLFARR